MIAPLFFYLFAGLCVASAFMVIAARNPVHSVLYLILAFVNAAGLFVLLGRRVPRDDPGRRLCRRGRGAVPVRGDDARRRLRRAARRHAAISADRRRRSAASSWPNSCWCWAPGRSRRARRRASPRRFPPTVTNTEALGLMLYTRYVYYFQIAGLVLLVAMIGAIVLTLRHRTASSARTSRTQNARDPASAIEIARCARARASEEGGEVP